MKIYGRFLWHNLSVSFVVMVFFVFGYIMCVKTSALMFVCVRTMLNIRVVNHNSMVSLLVFAC